MPPPSMPPPSMPPPEWFFSKRRCLAPSALVVSVGLLCGCVCPPAASVEARHGVVRAANEPQARAVAVALDELYDQVRRILPHTRDVRVDCWVQEQPQLFVFFPAAEEVGGFAVRALDRIHLRDTPSRLRSYLAHELVHVLLDDSWDGLPPALEEGLAEHVSFLLVPDPYHNDRPEKLLHALSVSGRDFWELCELRFAQPASHGGVKVVLESLDPNDPVVEPLRVFDSDRAKVAAFFSHDDTSVWYSLGFLAVSRLIDRHGYEGLHALCGEVRESAGDEGRIEVFTNAADLTVDPATWRQACLEELRVDDLRWYAEVTADQWASLTAKVSGPVYPDLDGQAFLEQARPALGVQDALLEVPLHDIPAFRGKLIEEWPEPANQPVVTRAQGLRLR